jgi:hypothetical protein
VVEAVSGHARLVVGITKAEHDALVAERGGRPLTQSPMRKRQQVQDGQTEGLSVIDVARAIARLNQGDAR